MSNEDTDEARRLIEEAFGGADRIAALVERADESTDAFVKAADAYGRGDLFASAAAMEGYALACGNRVRAAYDVCAAGAFVISAIVVATPAPCGHEICQAATRIDRESAPDAWTRLAVDCVNAAADRRPDQLGDLLNRAYADDGFNGLQRVAAMLVDTHRAVLDSRGDL